MFLVWLKVPSLPISSLFFVFSFFYPELLLLMDTILVVESRGDRGLPTVVDRWGEPDSKRCVVAAAVEGCSTNPVLLFFPCILLWFDVLVIYNISFLFSDDLSWYAVCVRWIGFFSCCLSFYLLVCSALSHPFTPIYLCILCDWSLWYEKQHHSRLWASIWVLLKSKLDNLFSFSCSYHYMIVIF